MSTKSSRTSYTPPFRSDGTPTPFPLAILAGSLQNNPVGFGVNEALGTIDIGGWNLERSRKYRNVADNGRAALVVDDVASTDPWRPRFVAIRGRAETVAEPTDSRKQAGAPAGPIIRLWPDRIITLGLQPGDGDREAHETPIQSRRVP